LTIGDNRDRGWIVATNKPEPRLDDFVDLTIHEPHMIDFNPNRKAATKGGSVHSNSQRPKATPACEGRALAVHQTRDGSIRQLNLSGLRQATLPASVNDSQRMIDVSQELSAKMLGIIL
jgi:hypothetical protein